MNKRIDELIKMCDNGLITSGEFDVLLIFNRKLQDKLELKELQDNCTHENIKYCSEYEMRSKDMQCIKCGKYGSDIELQGVTK